MVQSPARVQVGLSKSRQRQGPVKPGYEKLFYFRRFGKAPFAGTLGGLNRSSFTRGFWIFDPRDSLAIEKRRHIAALIPKTAGVFSDFVDDHRAAAHEDDLY